MPSIGSIPLAAPFCQAGLAGYSDRAMRVVARRRGCPYAVTEALLDTILLQGGEGLRRSIDINDEDHPVAGQIIGSDPQTMSLAASILATRGYDVIDLNFACPVKKIRNKARGGHMLRDVARGIAILRAVRQVLPNSILTLSLRRAFDENDSHHEALFALLEEAWQQGFAAARIHGRTVQQKYLGRADWSILRQVKRQYPDRTILGSGDVFTPEDAVRMKLETGVDVVWVARGAIGNPWIFSQARQLLAMVTEQPQTGANGTEARSADAREKRVTLASAGLQPPSIAEQRDALAEHFSLAMEIHGEELAGRRMRKMGIKYARFHPLAMEVKQAFISVRSLGDWRAVLDRFYSSDGPGIWPARQAVDEVNTDPDLQHCLTP
ncbi:MAG: tRNA-dihydrouridine synthase [Phycisphaerales bacterium]|nr:tRNA-dihydrouridine synthase [Phycisphaerales bacterium]